MKKIAFVIFILLSIIAIYLVIDHQPKVKSGFTNPMTTTTDYLTGNGTPDTPQRKFIINNHVSVTAPVAISLSGLPKTKKKYTLVLPWTRRITAGPGVILVLNADSSITATVDTSMLQFQDVDIDTLLIGTFREGTTAVGWANVDTSVFPFHESYNSDGDHRIKPFELIKPGDHVFYFSPNQYRIECEGSLMDSYGNLISHVNCYFKGILFSQNCDPNDKDDKENWSDAYIIGIGSESDCAYGEENLKLYLLRQRLKLVIPFPEAF